PTPSLFTLSLHDALPILIGIWFLELRFVAISEGYITHLFVHTIYCCHGIGQFGDTLQVILRSSRYTSKGNILRYASPHRHAHTRSEEHTSELQSRENLVC